MRWFPSLRYWVGAAVLATSMLLTPLASAYTWSPVNTAVRGEAAGRGLILGRNGSEEYRCRASFSGRTGPSGEETLRLTLVPSDCVGPSGERVTVSYANLGARLQATRLSQNTMVGEGIVWDEGSYHIDRYLFGIYMCTVGLIPQNRYPLSNEEFKLYESQYSGSYINIGQSLGYSATGPYLSYCEGSWAWSLITGSLSPYNLRITW
jgi:hypothetical protein